MASETQTFTDESGREIALDLTSCEREPIHIPGGVQPFGALIAISSDWVVSAASENVEAVIGLPHAGLVGTPLNRHLTPDAAKAIGARFQNLGFPDAVERIFSLDLLGRGATFDVALHVSGKQIVVEIEPTVEAPTSQDAAQIKPLIERLSRAATTTQLCADAARQLRALTGFDRVMVYRFDETYSGEVIAEAKRSDKEPFLNLRYPASDIPKQARALYLRNLLRIISDTEAEPVPITPPLDPENRPLDLSMSTLRATSPIHHEYLRNMGVRASMSISILRRGRLWGLFACHHDAPRVLSYKDRSVCELFGQFFSYALEQKENDEAWSAAEKSRSAHQNLSLLLADGSAIQDNLEAFARALGDIIAFDGVALCMEGHVQLIGRTPTAEQTLGVVRFLNRAAASQVFATSHLAGAHAPAADFADVASGVLALPISRTPRDFLILFRQEVAQSVTWAGRPDKPAEVGPNGIRLTPRKSFEAWREVVSQRAAPWTPAEKAAAEQLRVTMLEIILRLSDEAALERAQAQERQELLIAELNHRVRNILNLIRGLVSQSRDSAGSANGVDDFVSVLGGRIQSLARAHDQITKEQWAPGSLRELIEMEAAAYTGGKSDRIVIRGTDVHIAPTAFTTMALVIHELLTNAMKYGALVDSKGSVEIDIEPEAGGGVSLTWVERGGPPVQAPTRRGFGSTIIKRSVPFELKGTAEVAYKVGGLEASFFLPAFHVSEAAVTAPMQSAAAARGEGALSGNVLVVEDNMIIGLDVEGMVSDMGAEHVTLAGTVSEALAAIDGTDFTFAVLDVNLGSENSLPIAEALRAKGVPFLFGTGYGEVDGITSEMGAPVIQKPYSSDSLRQAVAAATA